MKNACRLMDLLFIILDQRNPRQRMCSNENVWGKLEVFQKKIALVYMITVKMCTSEVKTFCVLNIHDFVRERKLLLLVYILRIEFRTSNVIFLNKF